jgi:phospholipid/cholesterol/gamma-HCH transport system substrate-binding protein
MNKRTLINLIFFNAVFAVMLFWAANNIITIDRIERPYEITGDFAQAAGVKENAEVTYLGVHYGRVSDVVRIPEGVEITMKIDRGKDIPEGAVARIYRKSAIGEPYIDFFPPDGLGEEIEERIEPGGHVPIERTTTPLEFSELLRSASALVSSIDPESAGGLIHELSLALDGRGDDLRTITISMDQLTSSFVERTEQLDRLAENSTRVTGVLADHRLSLGQSIANLRAVAESLRNANGDIETLLDIGPDFLGTTANLVSDSKRNLDCLLTDLAPVLRVLNEPAQIDSLVGALDLSPLAFSLVAASVDHEADGPWARVNLLATTEGEEPAVYIPPKGLPSVPSVPACASSLRPVSDADFDATAGDQEGAAPDGVGNEDTGDGADGAGQGGDSGPLDGVGDLGGDGGSPWLVLLLVLLAGGLGGWQAWRLRRRGSTGADG